MGRGAGGITEKQFDFLLAEDSRTRTVVPAVVAEETCWL